MWKQKAYIMPVGGEERVFWSKDLAREVKRNAFQIGKSAGDIREVIPSEEGISTAYVPQQDVAKGIDLQLLKE
jgi:hypothetical protein